MERRYLVAIVALASTFAIVSHGFETGRIQKLPRSRAQVLATMACAKQYVAQQLVAKLEPYTGHQPEQAQMLAELNLPELARIDERVADAQILAEEQVAKQKCEAAMKARKATQHIYQMQILTDDRLQQLNNLAVIQAEELSNRAQQWQAVADARGIAISSKAIERAQEASVRAFEHAQRSMERSRARLAKQHAPGMPIHINFVAPAGGFTVSVPAPPDAPSPTIY